MFKGFLTCRIINHFYRNLIRIGLLICFLLTTSLFSFLRFLGFLHFFSFFSFFSFLCFFSFFSFFSFTSFFRFSFIFIRFRITFSNNFTISISGKLIIPNTFFTITYQETIVVKNITRAIFVRLKACYVISFNDTT